MRAVMVPIKDMAASMVVYRRVLNEAKDEEQRVADELLAMVTLGNPNLTKRCILNDYMVTELDADG